MNSRKNQVRGNGSAPAEARQGEVGGAMAGPDGVGETMRQVEKAAWYVCASMTALRELAAEDISLRVGAEEETVAGISLQGGEAMDRLLAAVKQHGQALDGRGAEVRAACEALGNGGLSEAARGDALAGALNSVRGVDSRRGVLLDRLIRVLPENHTSHVHIAMTLTLLEAAEQELTRAIEAATRRAVAA